MDTSALRRDFVTRPIYHMAKGVLPEMSDTEAEAIAAGDVWWDAALFSGDPDWQALLDVPPARLTEAERAFIDGPVDQLCAMLDDWKINWEDRDLPPESRDAMICTFECTFCSGCVDSVLRGVCPNCGGELVARPKRASAKGPSCHPGAPPRHAPGSARTR